MREILTPKSTHWTPFASKLLHTIWSPPRIGCDGTFKHATRLLAEMDGIAVPGTLAFFRESGGLCDCEILLNVNFAGEALRHEPT